MSSPEGISEKPKVVSIGHNDYEALVDGISLEVSCDHIPHNLEKGQMAYAKNRETGGRLPVEILAVMRHADELNVGTIRMKLHQLESRNS